MKRIIAVTEHTLFMAISLALVGVGVYQGLHLYTVRLNFMWIAVEIFLLDAVRAAVMFTVFFGVSAALFVWRMRRTTTDTVQEGPACAAIIPAYQEAESLPKAVSSLLSQTYENRSIIIVCEEDDAETRAVADHLAADHDAVEHVINHGTTGSKSGAINYAASQTDAPVIAVIDADTQPHEEFLSRAIAKIGDVDIVQGRIISEPGGLLETIAYYEDVLISALPRQLIYLFTDFRLALSNGTVMTRDAFETVNGYSDVLVEDFDFAFKCYRNNLDVAVLRRPLLVREPVHTVRDWWGQRKRWMTGYAQVFHTLLGSIPSFRSHRDLVSLFIAGSSLFGGGLMLILATKVVMLMLLGVETMFLLPATLLVLIGIGIHTADYRSGMVGRPSPVILVVPFVIPLFAAIAVKSLLSYIFTWDGSWYHPMRKE